MICAVDNCHREAVVIVGDYAFCASCGLEAMQQQDKRRLPIGHRDLALAASRE